MAAAYPLLRVVAMHASNSVLPWLPILLLTLPACGGKSAAPLADGSHPVEAGPRADGATMVDAGMPESGALPADAGAPAALCDGLTGLARPLATCSESEPCEDAFVIGLDGVTYETVTVASRAPSCASGAPRRASFDDGPPLSWTDEVGVTRYACVGRPAASFDAPRPLVLFFHGSGGDAGNVYNFTSLRAKAERFDLAGDGGSAGFVLASVQGRFLHWPTEHSAGSHHDYYYRDLGQNPDVAFTDHLIDTLVATGGVDPLRIYVMGWSNGATFAQLYAITRHGTPTPGGSSVAAGAVFAFASPYADVDWDQEPTCAANTPPTTVPLYMITRACDSLTACDDAQEEAFDLPPGHSATSWVRELRTDAGNPNVELQLIDGQGAASAQCRAASRCTREGGTVNHVRWPDGVADRGGVDWEPAMLGFLRDHPRD